MSNGVRDKAERHDSDFMSAVFPLVNVIFIISKVDFFGKLCYNKDVGCLFWDIGKNQHFCRREKMNTETYYGFGYFKNSDDEHYTIFVETNDKTSADALIWKLIRVGIAQINVEVLPHRGGFIVGSTKFNANKLDEIIRFISYYRPQKPAKKRGKKH